MMRNANNNPLFNVLKLVIFKIGHLLKQAVAF